MSVTLDGMVKLVGNDVKDEQSLKQSLIFVTLDGMMKLEGKDVKDEQPAKQLSNLVTLEGMVKLEGKDVNEVQPLKNEYIDSIPSGIMLGIVFKDEQPSNQELSDPTLVFGNTFGGSTRDVHP